MDEKKSQQNPEPSPTDRRAVGILSRKVTGEAESDRRVPRGETSGEKKKAKLQRIETPGKIRKLPEKLKIELDRRLSAGTFRSWRKLSKWFEENGYQISHAALHKYGQKFDRRLDSIRLATEQARIVCEQFKDDDAELQGAQMQSALMRLVQTRLFEVLAAVNEKPKRIRVKQNGQTVEKVAPVNITALARSVSGLVKAETENRKWAEHARAAVAAASKKLDEAKGKGLSTDVADQIRAVLMEI